MSSEPPRRPLNPYPHGTPGNVDWRNGFTRAVEWLGAPPQSQHAVARRLRHAVETICNDRRGLHWYLPAEVLDALRTDVEAVFLAVLTGSDELLTRYQLTLYQIATRADEQRGTRKSAPVGAER